MSNSENSSLHGKWALWGFVAGVLGSIALAALSVQAGGGFGAWLLRAAGVFAGGCLAFTASFGIDGWRHTTGKVAVIAWALCIVVLIVFRAEIKFLIRPDWARTISWKAFRQRANPAAVSLPAEKPARVAAQPAPEAPRPVDVAAVDLGGGVKMELVWVPAGSFQMGTPDYSDQGRVVNESPVHTVELDGFWMGKYEVTQVEYVPVMGIKNPNIFKSARNPMDRVSWNDAVEFCRKASQKTGKGFRLPTEAEWEYACRAGSTTRFCFGDSDSGLDEYAWYNGNSERTTHPAGGKKPNAWGLYDMHGNVWEWCGDWYAMNYEAGAAKNPQGPSSGENRVMRGGSWDATPFNCRSSFRGWHDPADTIHPIGFRVVCGGVSSR